MTGRKLWCLGVLTLGVAFAGAQAAASAPPGRYVADTTGDVVFDTRTKLTWQLSADVTPRDFSAASKHCASVEQAGNSDWRVPSIRELLSLVDITEPQGRIDPLFVASPATTFWSATVSAANAASAWTVSFDFGGSDVQDKGSAFRVRCVR
jgi:hypothetical protein